MIDLQGEKSMLISTLLQKIGYSESYTIENEQSFRFFALIQSNIDEPCCVFLDNDEYSQMILDSVRMVITTPQYIPSLRGRSFGICAVDKPRELFFQLHNALKNDLGYVRPNTPTHIGEGCHINPLCSIAQTNVSIGNNITIEEFVVIREHSVIGDGTIIRAGTVIGGTGFEFKRVAGKIMAVEHLGGVRIGSNVEIQNNTCIDRGVYPWDDTIIGDYCKIDNLVHIAHGVKVNDNVMIVANSGIGGRTEIGDNCWIGFGTTISNGIRIGNNARANIGAVVTKNVPDNGSVSGNFAIPHDRFIQNLKKSVTE